MNPHETQSESSILFTNLIYFFVWEIGTKSSTDEELRREIDDEFKFLQRRNITEIDTTKITPAWSGRQDHHPFWMFPFAKTQAVCTYKNQQ